MATKPPTRNIWLPGKASIYRDASPSEASIYRKFSLAKFDCQRGLNQYIPPISHSYLPDFCMIYPSHIPITYPHYQLMWTYYMLVGGLNPSEKY